MPWSTRGCAMTDAAIPLPTPVTGRSLWVDAWLRLKQNRAAVFSAVYLLFMAIACVVGPWLAPHSFNEIFQDYVRVPPSLSAYPKPDDIEPALKDALQRARVELAEWKEGEGGRI